MVKLPVTCSKCGAEIYNYSGAHTCSAHPRIDMAERLEELLRQFAEPNFYPFDEVPDKTATGRRTIPGVVRLAEVPRSAAKLMLEAADTIDRLTAERDSALSQVAAMRGALELASDGLRIAAIPESDGAIWACVELARREVGKALSTLPPAQA